MSFLVRAALTRVRRASLLAAVLTLACKEEPAEEATPAAASAVEAPPLSTSWEHPRDTLIGVGEDAPDFVALAHTGHQVRLSSELARPSVVCFFPSDADPATSEELESVRDAWLALRDRVGMVFGVSPDDNVTHRAFAADHDLPFLLLSDVDRAIASSFGVPADARVTVVVGKDRKVRRVLEKVRPKGHGEELVQLLDELGK
jgi:peroxiredoxin Q/BCP